MTEPTKRRREYRRRKRYTAAINAVMSEEMKADILEAADEFECSVNDIVRCCISEGLPLVRKKLRRESGERS